MSDENLPGVCQCVSPKLDWHFFIKLSCQFFLSLLLPVILDHFQHIWQNHAFINARHLIFCAQYQQDRGVMVANKKSLSVWMLVLITVGAVDNIRNLPTTALFGSKIIAFYVLASLFFLIPCALVSAEFSAKYPEESGIYSWVTKIFGPSWGLAAVWLQWVENVPFYPAILSFVAGTLGYMISPTLAGNRWFLLAVILGVFWLLTLVNIYGIRLSAWFSSFCTVTGLLIPMVLIISMGLVWALSNHQLAIHITRDNWLSHFDHLSVWVTMQGVLLGFCGIELATVHAKDAKQPSRSFPLALAISVIIIIVTLVAGTLSIAMIIPAKQLSLVSGIMNAFDVFLSAFKLHWVLPILGVMLAIGSLGGVNSWIIAPTRGLRIACQAQNRFPQLTRQNKHAAPVPMLLLQAVLVTVIVAVFVLIPSVNGAYWLLSVLAAQIYMMMYVIMFIASIVGKLRDSKEHAGYRIPGGRVGHIFVATLGLLGSLFAFVICFFPPSNVQIGSLVTYELLLVGGMFLLAWLQYIGI